jgi:hypothetical protein
VSAEVGPADGGVTAAPTETRAALGRWYGVATTFVAPATFLSALLFYFGYVTSRAQFRYFGVDVDTLGLTTRDFVMRSPQALLVPVLAAALAGVAVLLLHLGVRDRSLPRRVVAVTLGAGVALLGAGLVLLFGFAVLGDLPGYGLVTPALLGGGVGLALYTLRRPEAPHLLTADGSGGAARPGAVALALLVVATCVFWASATVAEWTGRGAAIRLAERLDDLPVVILDTQERLYLRDGVTRESELPQEEGQTFRYRYRGLRLLVQGADHLFLVPERWTPSNTTLAVPLDGTTRVRFQFVDLTVGGRG